MTFTEFDTFQETLLSEVVKMRDTKGKEYANAVDRFANFRRLSQTLGIPDAQIGWVYLTKHLDSISHFLKTGNTASTETIPGRFVDAITYLTLIAGMVEEANRTPTSLNPMTTSTGIHEPVPDRNTGKHQPFEYDPKK